jgi:RNA polymerase sigma factor (sigma-70 family)
MENESLIPRLFRTEYRKIVSVLCGRFGFDRIEIAEDIAADTFLTAAEMWGINGIPENPTAWLYTVAKNNAKNYLHRTSLFKDKIAPELQNSPPPTDDVDIDLSPQNINDSQLQMMFALCHPSIPPEAQIGLSLRLLCGFGIEEIADAFLTNKETISKRLLRAKEKLRDAGIKMEMPSSTEIDKRLDTVLQTIYLLFNEGYYSVSQNTVLRKDVCLEAMRLCSMLVENEPTNKPAANALLSLMCFHASRFEARTDRNGDPVLYEDQDTSLWDTALISRGGYFMNRAASGNRLTRYHVEAAIAYWHTVRIDTKEKWENILQLYNQLLQIEYSPIAALNRTYALSKANGKQEAIVEAEKLKLTDNHFYFALLGELYTGIDDKKAKEHFQQALSLAKTTTDKKAIQKKIISLKP